MKQILTFLLDLLYPPKCVICRRILEKGETDICPDCMEALPNFEGAAPRVDCADDVVVTFFYENDLRESFLRFKFSGRDFYGKIYGRWMADRVLETLGRDFDFVSWVPVSRRRLHRRGYDQSGILARVIAQKLALPMYPALQKHAERGPQSHLHDAAQRKENASGAFSMAPGADVSGKRILLIDDIVTTGATLSECCRVLKFAGAKRVSCALFASPRERWTT